MTDSMAHDAHAIAEAVKLGMFMDDAASRGLAGSLSDRVRWYVGLPLRNLFGSREGKRISELELTFEQGQDAQAIYWHFFDGIKGIIL